MPNYSVDLINKSYPVGVGGSVAEPMWWVGCGAYVVANTFIIMPLRGSILQVETCQILSLAENPRWSRVWQKLTTNPVSVSVRIIRHVSVSVFL